MKNIFNLKLRTTGSIVIFIISGRVLGQTPNNNIRFDIGLYNSMQTSRCVMDPVPYMRGLAGWTDWINFYSPSIEFSATKNRSKLSLIYANPEYSCHTRNPGYYYDSQSKSWNGGGGSYVYHAADNIGLNFGYDLTPISKLRTYAGIGAFIILPRVGNGRSYSYSESKSQYFSMQDSFGWLYQKKVGYAICTNLAFEYALKKYTFHASLNFQLGIRNFIFYDFKAKFNESDFNAIVKSKGDAVGLKFGVSRLLNFGKK